MNRSKQHLIGFSMMIGPFVAVAAYAFIVVAYKYVQQNSTTDIILTVAVVAGTFAWFGTGAKLLNK